MSRQKSTRLNVTNLEDRLTPAGWLDTDFGVGGVVQARNLTKPHYQDNTPSSQNLIGSLPDGRIVFLSHDSTETAVLKAYHPDGTIDTSFGTNGELVLGNDKQSPFSLAVSPTGMIYALTWSDLPLGQYSSLSRLYRVTPSGQLDATFGNGGVVNTDSDSIGFGVYLATLANGNAVVGNSRGIHFKEYGSSTNSEFSPEQLGGPFVAPRSYSQMFPTSDGGITFAGVMEDESGSNKLYLTHIGPDGETDRNYGVNGHFSLEIPEQIQGVKQLIPIGIDSQNRVTLAYSGYEVSTNPWGMDYISNVLRFTADGQLDVSFSEDGIAEVPFPNYVNTILAGEILPDGRTLLFSQYSYNGFLAQTLTSAGDVDTTVANGDWLSIQAPALSTFYFGQQITPYARNSSPVTVLPDGRVAVYGKNDKGTVIAVLDLDAETPANGIFTPPTPGSGIDTPTFMPGEPSIEAPLNPPVEFPLELPAETPIEVPVETPVVYQPISQPLLPVPGDFNGDRVADSVVTTGSSIRVMSGTDGSELIAAFNPFEAGYTGDLNYAVADLDGDGKAELLVSPSVGGGGIVAVYSSTGQELTRFYGIQDLDFRGGNTLNIADVNGDGMMDLIATAGPGGGPRVAVFDGRSMMTGAKRLMADFFAFESSQTGGVNARVTEDQIVFGAGVGGAPRVRGVMLNSLATASQTGFLNTDGGIDRFVGDPMSREGIQVFVENGYIKAKMNSTPAVNVARFGTDIQQLAENDELNLHGAFID
ncbi:MAG: FG-GAP repeat domain-containing protein [Fimbriiglobus sp.]